MSAVKIDMHRRQLDIGGAVWVLMVLAAVRPGREQGAEEVGAIEIQMSMHIGSVSILKHINMIIYHPP